MTAVAEPLLAGLGLAPAAEAAALELLASLPPTEHDGVEDAAQVRAAGRFRSCAPLCLLSRRLARPAPRADAAAVRTPQAVRLRLAFVAFVAASLEAGSIAQASAGGGAVTLSLILQRTGVRRAPQALPAATARGARRWRRAGAPLGPVAFAARQPWPGPL